MFRTPPITVRPLACEVSLAMDKSDFQTLQADTEPTHAIVEPLLADCEHSSIDSMPLLRDPEHLHIGCFTDHQASPATIKGNSRLKRTNFAYLCSTKRTLMICTGCART